MKQDGSCVKCFFILILAMTTTTKFLLTYCVCCLKHVIACLHFINAKENQRHNIQIGKSRDTDNIVQKTHKEGKQEHNTTQKT